MHAPVPADNRPTTGFILLAGSLTAFGALSIDLYLPALPSIARDFGATAAAAQFTVSAFLAGMAIGQLGFGPLSDRVGRRLPLLAGILLYTLASLALVFAPSIETLSAGRFVQGLGACAGVVISRAVVRDRFDTTESARLFSLTFLVLAVAPMLAPTLGAGLMHLFGWHSIFLVLVAFGLAVGAAVFFGLPESLSPEAAAQAAGESPLGSYWAALKDPHVLGFVGAGALNGASLFAYIAASPALFMEHFHQPPSAFGWIFALNALGLVFTTQINRRLLLRFPPDVVARRGSLAALGFAAILLLLALFGQAGLGVTMALLFLGLGSYGFVSANSSALALGAMPERAGAISALIGAGAFAFGALAGALTAPFAAAGPLAMAAAMAAGFAGSAWALHRVTRA
ncbi:multidrug effflux MFS transporter [Sandaracinobacter sp. RS1-74]|uniref:multidrug effflux MFS transporter n=1 Tax=Sandaracinobacteroides sayramensis TaxID=2913411 RepID=UPI001EDBAF60|nr:multidrug effflux MFS transporter [Sandaracinobacteroides sayramensis]MCG2841969.1 multidrug effflux MFS transporter [Sandaracinobacteroides sayramensis]